MNKLKCALKLLKGQKKCVFWAIINSCNCKCKMCSMWKQKPKAVKNYEELIDFMAKNKVFFLSITGGEPLMHPRILDIIKYAKSKGLFIHMSSNGTLLTLNKAKELKNAGLEIISFSIDHYIPKIQDSLRGHLKAHKKTINAITYAKKAGLNVSTSTVLTKLNIGEIDKIIEFVDKKLCVNFSLCTPHFSKSGSFFEKKSKEINLSKEEIIQATNKIIDMKNKGFNVINSFEFLKDYINWMQGKPKYYCQGGEIVYYLNPKGDFYPCFNKKKIFDIKTGWKDIKMKCYDCNIQCFKEPSIINQMGILKGIHYLLKSFKKINNF